jgi:hypothetical protein
MKEKEILNFAFVKGKVYGVDVMEDVPKEIYSEFFDLDFEEVRDDKLHELGSGLCSKSFKLTITIKY